MKRTIQEKYDQYVVEREIDECWTWEGPVTTNGSPYADEGKQRWLVRRWAYHRHFGYLPKESIFTSCQNHRCLNPHHFVCESIVSRSTLRTRLEKKLNKQQSGCWLWKGGAQNGQGKIRIGKKIVAVRRAAWEIYHGKIPSGMFVKLTCDNKLCCNPDHLYLSKNKRGAQRL